MDLSRPLTYRQEICTQVGCWVKLENLSANVFLPCECFFTPPLKIGGENLKFRWTFADRRQSKARYFKAAQHTGKQKKTDVSSTLNALKRYQTWGNHSTGCWCNL